MKQGKQFFFLTLVNKESGYESEKIALASQDQVISWVTTLDYRVLVKSNMRSIINAAFWLVELLLGYML